MTTMKTKTMKKPILLACAAVMAVALLAAGVWGGLYYANNVQIDSVISLDVNPSLEITANKRDTVLEVRAVNADAKAVLDGMELEGTNLNTAVNAIIGSMLRLGYLNNGENEILVSVQNDDPTKVQAIQSLIDSTLQSSSINVPVVSETVENDAQAEALAEKEQISVGKAAYILDMIAADPSLDADELADMSIKELNELKNGSSAESTEPTQTQPDATEPSDNASLSSENTTSGSAGTQATITAERAKEIALNHAGLSAGQVTFLKAKLDYEDGIRVYDIEFYSGNTEYDYEINAQTGAIHSFDRDIENYVIPGNGNTSSSTGSAGQSPSITAEKAKEIALKHAGLSAGQVTFLKAKLDYEDGIRVYDIEFYSGNTEYDYEINAQTGAIHSFDRDIENYVIPGIGNAGGNAGSAAAISVERAKEIALKYAGLSANAVGYIEVDMDYEHGVLVYEIEFKKGFMEYEFEINAQTGEILKYERDWDD